MLTGGFFVQVICPLLNCKRQAFRLEKDKPIRNINLVSLLVDLVILLSRFPPYAIPWVVPCPHLHFVYIDKIVPK
jgi:hypothetical protein